MGAFLSGGMAFDCICTFEMEWRESKLFGFVVPGPRPWIVQKWEDFDDTGWKGFDVYNVKKQ